MSEPTGDVPSPPSQNPADDPSPTVRPAPALPATLLPTPRTNPPSVYNQKDASQPAAEAPGYNDFLTWIQAFASAQSAPPPPATPGERTLLGKAQKKFHKFDPEAAKAEAKTDTPIDKRATEDAQGEDEISGRSAPPATSGVPERSPVVRKRRPPQSNRAPRQFFPFSWRAAILGALLLGCFFFGRASVPKIAPVYILPATHQSLDRDPSAVQTDGLIDHAMAAAAERDFKKATSLLEQIPSKTSHVAGTTYQLALLAFEEGNAPRALNLLSKSIDAGEEVAACYNLRGSLINRTAGGMHGLDNLETATQLDPYNAKYFYYLGEALRRAGKPQAALVRLYQAINRLREPSLLSLYELKVRLTKIELGQGAEFADQLKAELQSATPSIDWLFTAAAVEMRNGDFKSAAGYLDRIFAVTDQQTADARLRDFFFYSYASEKSLAQYFASSSRPEAVKTTSEHPVDNSAAAMPFLPATQISATPEPSNAPR